METEMDTEMASVETDTLPATTTTDERASSDRQLADPGPPPASNLELDQAARSNSPHQSDQSSSSSSTSSIAQAAKILLDSVSHEDGTKWKNSAFLSLMRDLRDGTKDIVGDTIVTDDHDPAQG